MKSFQLLALFGQLVAAQNEALNDVFSELFGDTIELDGSVIGDGAIFDDLKDDFIADVTTVIDSDLFQGLDVAPANLSECLETGLIPMQICL